MKENNCKLYDGQKHTIYEIQKEIGVSKDMLYKYARGYRSVIKMNIKTINDIAYFEKTEPNKLFNKMVRYEKKRNKKGTIKE